MDDLRVRELTVAVPRGEVSLCGDDSSLIIEIFICLFSLFFIKWNLWAPINAPPRDKGPGTKVFNLCTLVDFPRALARSWSLKWVTCFLLSASLLWWRDWRLDELLADR